MGDAPALVVLAVKVTLLLEQTLFLSDEMDKVGLSWAVNGIPLIVILSKRSLPLVPVEFGPKHTIFIAKLELLDVFISFEKSTNSNPKVVSGDGITRLSALSFHTALAPAVISLV